jgi:two-component system, NarL family, response regulator LiaR
MDVLRLVLVDDYRMVTEALASRLSSAPDLWVAGCCQTDDPRLPEVVRWLRPDVVLIDVEPLGMAIAEVLSRIRAAWPDARIIVVSADEEASHAVAAARAGADAWVSKSQGADQLETVLRGVARGHSWFPPEMLGEVIRGLRDDVETARESSNLLDTLSPRELDVLTSMAKGKRARQIAAELLISADTVRTHTRSIFGKLEVHSRIEAVSVAWAAGLRPEESGPPDDESPGNSPSPEPGEGRLAARRERRAGLPAGRGSGSGGSGPGGSASGRSGSGGSERGGRPAPVAYPTRGAQPGHAGDPRRDAETGRDGRPGPRGPAPGMSRLNPGPAAWADRPGGSSQAGSSQAGSSRGGSSQAGGRPGGSRPGGESPGGRADGGGETGGSSHGGATAAGPAPSPVARSSAGGAPQSATGRAGGRPAGEFVADGVSSRSRRT